MKDHPYLRKPEPYLMKTELRGKKLFALIRPHLMKGDRILDSGCGYSPMADLLLASGYGVTGFDINAEVVAHMKNHQSRGEWWCIPYEEATFTGYTVLLLLGAGASWNGEDFHDYLLRVITQNQIRFIFMEMAHSLRILPRHEGYNYALSILQERGYHQIDAGYYESGMDGLAATRTYNIFTRIE